MEARREREQQINSFIIRVMMLMAFKNSNKLKREIASMLQIALCDFIWAPKKKNRNFQSIFNIVRKAGTSMYGVTVQCKDFHKHDYLLTTMQ